MPQTTLRVERPLDEVWERLQQLDTWEGVGGMDELRSPEHRADGSLARFQYSLDTPIGTVSDEAEVSSTVDPEYREMIVQTETKGIRVRIDLDLTSWSQTSTDVSIALDASAANFLTKPLAATLRHTLESGIDREAERMRARLEASH